jgi:lipopolysaccharide export system ATP-binding protein
MDPILVADSIGKRFRRRQVLSSASIWATPGRLTALLGRNGTGKSTLIKIAAGWMRPNYGVVVYKEERFARPHLARLAQLGLFYLPERSLLCTTRTVRQHFDALARHFVGASVEEAIDNLRLEEFLDREPRGLSGGERRRAEVALAVARQPDCLLADEPLQGLAPLDAELVGDALRSMALKGCAVIASGHEVPALLEVADEVVWQTAGTTHLLGSPNQARSNHQFVREYLGLAGLAR